MALFGNVEIIKERVKIVTKEMIKNRKCKICILPNSVEIIDDQAFFHYKKLKKLIFVDEEGKMVNNKIVTIKNLAFADTKIREFTYSHYLHLVGEYAFSDTPYGII